MMHIITTMTCTRFVHSYGGSLSDTNNNLIITVMARMDDAVAAGDNQNEFIHSVIFDMPTHTAVNNTLT